jgi:hypothetical protein
MKWRSLSAVKYCMNNRLAAGMTLAAVICLSLLFLRPKSQPEPAGAPTRQSQPIEPPSAAARVSALPPSQEELWSRPIAEPAFARFTEWTRRSAAAGTDKARTELAAEGVELARVRAAAMAQEMQTNPKRAIELAVPRAVRDQLPAAVRALVEEPVNARGDLEVLGFRPQPGDEKLITPVVRFALIDGERHQVFTYDGGLRFVSKRGVPLDGIRLPLELASRPPGVNGLEPARFLMALSETPARTLDATEIAYMKQSHQQAQAAEPVCAVSGREWTADKMETAVELAGEIKTFCGQVHAEDWAGQAVAAAGMETPSFPLAGAEVSESSYTEGRKKMLVLRPYWSDQAVAMSTNSALSHFASFSNYMFQMSYGKLVFAPLRRGSDISPEILMPGSVTSYSSGLGSIFTAIKDVARTNYGMDSANYDFVYYVTGSRPSASYAGLGFVGGVGFHLANGYFDAATASHEFGHNLGLNHAHFWDTASQSIIGNGQNVEYGDGNDPMGGGGDPNQYNSRYKNYLGWIPGADVADLNTTGSGLYRLYCFDLDYSVGLRGLKFRRSGSQNYWINFRQRKTSKPSLMNGVQLLWTGNGNEGSYLLDAQLRGGSDDNAIVIGRTFTDLSLKFHVTPVGKGNTFPQSIDVMIFTNTPATNIAPIATLTASTLNPGAGQSVTFTAAATDANDDALAYYWEFGDGTYSSNNQLQQSHSYGSAGEYAVRCVVSDMRGGTAQHTLIVRVGSPAVFRISGHVVDNKSRPLPGVLVSAGITEVYTDSDGSYTIPGLAAGSYSLTAIEPVAGSLGFVHPYFNNPVTVGPSFTTADFVGVPGSLNIYTPLLVKGTNNWRYLDNGSDQGQGTEWRMSTFNDSGWSNGVAPLGYPSGAPITTVVGFGPDSNNKFTTTYFRRQFTVANPGSFTNFLLEVLRDDGVVVYLNGTEVFRNNLPTNGSITYLTHANDSVEPDSYLQLTLPAGSLLAGTNIIAAEVHQSDATSSDIALDVGVSGLSVSNAAGFTLAYFTAPVDNAVFTSTTNITLSAAVWSGITATQVQYYVNTVRIGADTNAPFDFVWNNPPVGAYSLTAVASVGSLLVTSPAVRVTVAAPAPATVTLPLITAGSTWRWWFTNVGAPAGWQNTFYGDNAWVSGAAKLGFGGSEALGMTLYGGPSPGRYPAGYFRRMFNVEDPAGITNLNLLLKRDDGAAVYLNGIEVVRDGLTNGVPIAYADFATNAADGGTIFYPFSLPVSDLRVGTNVIAVEVHQSSTTSSDLAFDLSLTGLARTNRARGCWLAEVVAGGTLGVALVEFYANGVKVGQDAAAPYSFDWTNPVSGGQTLVAVATDTAGNSITSASVNVTITPPPAGVALISFGDTWKYLDDGTDQGSAWSGGAFDDRTWSSGPARLGYGGDGEVTTVSFGTNAAQKHVTTWFRKSFSVASPAAFSGLLLRLVRDDGAAVYLNGVEVYRNNLQAGLVSWNSLATATADGAAETTPLDVLLGTTNLIAGVNVIAVEIHQASAGSSDLGFNLALTGLMATNLGQGIYLTSPAQGARYNSPATVPLSAFVAAPTPVTLVEYFAGPTKIGQSAAQPYSFNWNNPAVGTYTLTARATYGAGLVLTSPPVTIAVGFTPAPVATISDTLIPAGATWRYWDNAAAVGANWTTIGFNDTAWPSGPARFGFGLDGEITPLTEGRVTHYFRRWINVTNPYILSELIFRLQRDDGAVVYLNGTEVYRSNMPGGTVTASTLASATVNTPDETTFFETSVPVAGLNLLSGSNLVAVELHQASTTSSDGGFDLQLLSYGNTEPRVYFTSPANGAGFASTATVAFDGHAFPGTGFGLQRIELFADGVLLTETNTTPFHFTWAMPPTGAHSMMARLTDSRGATVDSAPLLINVVRDPVTTTFIPSNSVWKYFASSASQGTGWVALAYNDAAWPSGPARLGFSDGAVTSIDIGPSNNRYPTIYFRRKFVVPPGAVYTNLLFKLSRDDGAVVHLNGREAYRDNMPAGVITYTNFASTGAADELTFFPTNIAITNLPAGTNIVTVEVHQNNATSGDLGFDLELTASGYLEDTSIPTPTIEFTDDRVEISWPSAYTTWRLYGSDNILRPMNQWTLVPVTPVIAGGRIVVIILPSQAAQFYRLGKP